MLSPLRFIALLAGLAFAVILHAAALQAAATMVAAPLPAPGGWLLAADLAVLLAHSLTRPMLALQAREGLA